jgi:SNF2 family DNA or RNA helicase
MSGTFIENKIDEIFPPLSLVAPGVLGKFHNFKNNYLIFDYWGKIVGIRNEKRLKKLIKPYIIRRSIDEVWKDRPPLVENTRVCEMTPKQRKFYEDAKVGALRELENKDTEHKINVAEIGALLNYLIQICDTTETMDAEIKESGKIDVLKDIVSDEISSKHKVVLFSFFANKVIPILLRELSPFGKCLVITGNIEAEEAERRKQRFMRCDDIRFLLCSDSMAYGANLQAARYVINFDLPWNPAKIEQRIRRVYRKGQTKSVTVTNLVTTDSVEDNILEKIGTKRKIFDSILGISTVKKKSLSLDDMLAVLRGK